MHCIKKIKPAKADRWFKRLQLFSSAWLSIGHGLNDSQKVMGIIAAALIVATHQEIPGLPHWMHMNDMADLKNDSDKKYLMWIPIACFTAISIGTMSGGWKIMKTMGNRITKITPVEGFSSQLSGAITLFITEIFKIPVSTTHVITGSIIGVGSVKRLSAVRWGVTVNLLWAWILTIPISALLAMLVYVIINAIC